MSRMDGRARVLSGTGVVCVLISGVLWVTGSNRPPEVRVSSLPPASSPSPSSLSFPSGPSPSSPPPGPSSPGVTAGAATAVPPSAGLLPSSLRLPGRGVPVPVLPTSATPSGQLVVPDDPATVGWWVGGAAPGDRAGTVVIVGHIDSATRGLGVFVDLVTIAVGSSVTLQDSAGRAVTYVVTAREEFSRTALPPQLFTRQGEPRLVLITCGGTFDRTRQQYADNIVVTAEPVPTHQD